MIEKSLEKWFLKKRRLCVSNKRLLIKILSFLLLLYCLS